MNLYLPLKNILPQCDIEQFPIKSFNEDVQSEYSKLLNLIQDYVSADCWAFVINNDFLFNSYTNHAKTFNEIINEEIIRDKISENAQSILVQINHRGLNTAIDICMFPKDYPFKLRIIYNANERKYIVQRMNSQAFIDTFGNDNTI
jgi:hypothetical protein